MEMTEEQLRVRVRELAPFHHAVELSARRKTYLPEMSYRTVERTRVDSLMRHGWPQLLEACGGSLRGRRVLDIACNCGGFSVEAIKAGVDYVLGVDIVDRYLDQAEFIKQALGYPNLDFRKVDVFDLSPELGGHLRCGSLCRFFLIRSLWKMDVIGVGERASQTTNLWREGFSCQFAPTDRAVLDMLSFLGFNHSEVLQPTEKGLEPRYYKRERGTFLAVR
jgi:hypothetical protein